MKTTTNSFPFIKVFQKLRLEIQKNNAKMNFGSFTKN